MANELQYYGDPVVDTGLTVVARVYDSSGVQVGSDVATTEVGALAIYRGNMPVAVEGNYGVRFFNGTLLLGQETMSWDGTAEIDLIETKAQADARQALLIAEHDATQAAIAGLNDFDSSADVVAHVTLVDTTTTNTDMRGTASAITSLTPVTDAITAQTVDLKGASDKDLTQVFDNTPSVNLTPVTDALTLQDIEIAEIKTQSTLARKHLTNRDKIDTTAKTLTRYDDDGTTALVVFDLKDNTGLPSSLAIFEKDPQ